ncbi:MAG: hypothetical protein KME27_18805 [Lyngbya sp. HA4199-MV5]|jgi:putative glutathione S-transferase|nr:hypothetical protein [Lyngbya sp. HA4199-MV5]
MSIAMMIDSEWKTDWERRDQLDQLPTTFRDRITADGLSGFKAEAGR